MLAPEILKFPWLRGRADEVVDTIGHLVIQLNPSHFCGCGTVGIALDSDSSVN